MNTLIVIGWTGNRRAYLNVLMDEAVRRFLKAEDMEGIRELPPKIPVHEFTFTDEFCTDDAYPKE